MYRTTKRTTEILKRLGVWCYWHNWFELDGLLAECRKRKWLAEILVFENGEVTCSVNEIECSHKSNPAEALGRAMVEALKEQKGR